MITFRQNYWNLALSNKTIFLVIGFSVLFHGLATWFNVGNVHPDGHFQLLEFAWHKLGHSNANDMPWEYHGQIRSSIQPMFVYGVHKLLGIFGVTNPFDITLFLRLISSVLGFSALFLLTGIALRWFENENHRKYLFISVCLFWIFPTFHSAFNSESWSGSALCLGIWFFLKSTEKKETPLATRYAAVAGVLFGLAFFLRFTLGFSLLGIACWAMLIQRLQIRLWVALAAGFSLTCLFNVALDSWFYGQWVFTPANYFELNIVQDIASIFGVDPWWYYLRSIVMVFIPPFGLVVLLLMVIGCITHFKNIAVWIVLPSIFVYSFVSHKETRVIYSLLNFFPILIMFGVVAVSHMTFPKFLKSRILNITGRFLMLLYLAINIVLLVAISVTPGHQSAIVQKWIYEKARHNTLQINLYERDPYTRGKLTMNYYMANNLKLQRLENSANTCDSLAQQAQPVYVFTRALALPENFNCQNRKWYLEIASMPAWVRWIVQRFSLKNVYVWSIYSSNG